MGFEDHRNPVQSRLKFIVKATGVKIIQETLRAFKYFIEITNRHGVLRRIVFGNLDGDFHLPVFGDLAQMRRQYPEFRMKCLIDPQHFMQGINWNNIGTFLHFLSRWID